MITTNKLTEAGHYWMRRGEGYPWGMAIISFQTVPESIVAGGKIAHFTPFGRSYSEPAPLDAEFIGPIQKPQD